MQEKSHQPSQFSHPSRKTGWLLLCLCKMLHSKSYLHFLRLFPPVCFSAEGFVELHASASWRFEVKQQILISLNLFLSSYICSSRRAQSSVLEGGPCASEASGLDPQLITHPPPKLAVGW